MSRKACPEDVDEICGGLPETELKKLVREFFGD